MEWPGGKKFAFTIIDDTDNGTVSNLKPVYDLLNELGIKTTKTVWVYPPRDSFGGECLLDQEYLEFVKKLEQRGFEIALHNVGSGSFARDEILSGVETFREIMGFYPTMQINHASNLDNIYWGAERYTRALRGLMRLVYGNKREYYGTNPSSKHFWGDISKKHFKYIRNHTFNGINTLKYDPKMPYKVAEKDEYSNYWFSSSDAHTVEEFNNLVTPKKVLQLEKENGLCIVYTHFASSFVDQDGRLDAKFEANVRFLSEREGWFAPAGEILDYLQDCQPSNSGFISHRYLVRLDTLWFIERLIKKIRYRR